MTEIIPLGEDFVVSSTTKNDQADPTVATLTNGNQVVVWTSDDTGFLSEQMVRGRILGPDGHAIGDDFLLTKLEAGYNYAPTVTPLANGGFLACWSSGSPVVIKARYFDSTGEPEGGERRISPSSLFSQHSPVCAAQPDGSVLVLWHVTEPGGIVTRGCVLDADRKISGDIFDLETSTPDTLGTTVKALQDGRYFIAYRTQDASGVGANGDVFGRFVNPDGSYSSDEILINNETNGVQAQPSFVELPDGRLFITWSSYDGVSTSYYDIKARILETDGSFGADEFLLNTTTANGQFDPQTVVLPSGRLFTVWSSTETMPDGVQETNLFGRYLDENGAPIGQDFIVNSYRMPNIGNWIYVINARYPSVSVTEDGRILVVWPTESGYVDLSGDAILGRYFVEANVIEGGDGDDSLSGGSSTDFLDGRGGNDVLTGHDGGDILDGGAGGDSMTGGLGDDLYYVDSPDDRTIEESGGGIDLVRSAISITLADNVESLELTGQLTIDAAGNRASNRIEGNDASNTINGMAGRDHLLGNGQNDRISGGGNHDIIEGGTGRDRLSGGIGNDILQGDDDDDRLYGNSGNDVLNGGRGIDILEGGSGGDRFVFTIDWRDAGESDPLHNDYINDFSRIEGDRIDLSAVDANTFSIMDFSFQFIGSAQFTGTAQIRYENGVIYGNNDNQLDADFYIVLSNNVGELATGDFIL